ncbi:MULTISPECIES: TIGR04222 domain-containing membrane protein [unclassified Kitasatospora]|uniref:TIGR04222 domain-containing membrane protein n=1 Tax=unclassified Kitasatospora TaxID=2633591 RepID=UPI00382F8471
MLDFRFFLAFALVACAVTVSAVFNRRSRRVTDVRGLPGRGLPLLDAAFLAGGPARVVDTALVRMEREGRLVISRAHRVTVTSDRTSDPVERVLVTAVGGRAGRDLSVLRTSVMGSPEVQRIGDGLAARGLLRNPAALRAARRAHRMVLPALLVAVVLGAVSTVRWLNGPWESAAPAFVPYFPLVLFTVLALVVNRPPRSRITPAGLRQLQLMRGGSAWRPREVEREHARLVGAFALDGTAALSGSAHRALREALDGTAAAPARPARGSRRGRAGGGTEYAAGAGAGAGAGAWCGTSSGSSCGSSGHSGGSHHSCGSSSSHSCGGSSHSCGSSSSCGSSCGGGGCGGS